MTHALDREYQPKLPDAIQAIPDLESPEIAAAMAQVYEQLLQEWKKIPKSPDHVPEEIKQTCKSLARGFVVACSVFGLEWQKAVLAIQERDFHSISRGQFSWKDPVGSNENQQPCLTLFVREREWQLKFYRNLVVKDLIHEVGEWWLSVEYPEYQEREEQAMEAKFAEAGKNTRGKVDNVSAQRIWSESPKEQLLERLSRQIYKYCQFEEHLLDRFSREWKWQEILAATIATPVLIFALYMQLAGTQMTGELTDLVAQVRSQITATTTSSQEHPTSEVVDLRNPDNDIGESGEVITTGDVRKLLRLLATNENFTVSTQGMQPTEIEQLFQELGNKFDKLVGIDPLATGSYSRDEFIAKIRSFYK